MAARFRRRAVLAAALAAPGALSGHAGAGGSAPMPGPAPIARRASAAADNARCEGCHAEIAAEWRGSLHHRAHTDPAYQRALAIEPLAFCRGCHAPEADPDRDPPAALGALGVGCVSCHAAGEGVLASPREGAPPAPHAVLRAPAFATAAACASCHEFPFPDPQRRRQPALMQSTAAEHQASPFAGVACAGCHMPVILDGGDPHTAGASHRSHAFAASGDPDRLRAALHVTAARAGDGTVEVRLSANGVGHAFPTGDLFRRVEVLAEAVGPEQQALASDVRYLARRFGEGAGLDGRPVRVLLSDSRVSPAGEAVVRLSPGPAAKGVPVAWRVAYQRVAHPVGSDGDAAVVEGEVEIARGVLPP